VIRPVTLAAFLSLSIPAAALPQQRPRPETPSEADIPKPVPFEVGLAGDERPDILRFLNVRRASAPSLSPDGKRLAFRTDITGKPQVWIVDVAGGWPEQITFGEPVTFHEWSPAGDWIAYGTDRGGNEREGFYLVAPDGRRERELLAPSEAFRMFGGFSPDGKRIAYATTERNGIDFDIHVIEVVTGADREAHRGEGGLYVASWRPDGGALLLSETRGEDGNDVHHLDLASGKLETLFRPEVSASYGSFTWKPDGGGFYLVTDQDRDFRGLALFDVGKRALAFLETPERDVERVALRRDGRVLAWTTNEGGFSALHLRDLETGGAVDAPELPKGIYGFDWAEKAPVAAIQVSGPRIPGDVWTWASTEPRAARATRSSLGGLDPGRFVEPAHVDLPGRDGVTLHGLLYLPASGATKPPVLLAVHGGPTGQARPGFQAVHQYLLARGIAVLDLNFRGSTGYGKTFARLDNQRLRPNAVRDMEDAVRWLERDGRVDAKRAAVMGGSYGGYMTYAAVTTFPDLFRGGVSLVGVSNWVTALEGASPQLKASDRIEYGNIDDPADREFFRELSPLTHVKNVRAPLLVSHGANDPRDPVTESDQFVRAIRENGGEVEYLRFPDEGHGIRKLENRIIAYRRIAAFLERILGPPGETAGAPRAPGRPVGASAPVEPPRERESAPQASPEKPPLARGDAEKKILAVLAEMVETRGDMHVPENDGRLLRLLVESTKAKNVVEIGTSNGYSAIWIALALRSTGGRLITHEIDSDRAKTARANFDRAGVADLVTIVEGDAHETVGRLEAPIDVLFLDADKSGYLDYLQKLLPLVRSGGLVLAHNMNRPRPDAAFLEAITTNPDLETLFFHMDAAGMAVTLKKAP